MEKNKTDIIIERSKLLYKNIISAVGQMYGKIFSKSGKYSSETEIYKDFDSYLQAALIKICSLRGRFADSEMKFIKDIAEFGSLIPDADFSLYAGCNSDMREKLSITATERLKKIPVCFMMAAAVDAKLNKGITKFLTDNLIKTAFNFSYLESAGESSIKGGIMTAFESLYGFIKNEGVNL